MKKLTNDSNQSKNNIRWIKVEDAQGALDDDFCHEVLGYGHGEYLVGYLCESEESNTGYEIESEGVNLLDVTHIAYLNEPDN